MALFIVVMWEIFVKDIIVLFFLKNLDSGPKNRHFLILILDFSIEQYNSCLSSTKFNLKEVNLGTFSGGWYRWLLSLLGGGSGCALGSWRG